MTAEKYTNVNSEQFARLFRLIAAAKDEASILHLGNVENLASIALLQLAADWEGVNPSNIGESELALILRRKEKFAASRLVDNLAKIERH